jgi:acyl CoA:acetate/3-ketoacid CoA transferase
MVEMSDEPTDRLTRLAAGITAGLESEENADVRAIIMLDDGNLGGIMMHGYDDGIEAMTDLLIHMRAIFKAYGKDIELITIPDSPEGL